MTLKVFAWESPFVRSAVMDGAISLCSGNCHPGWTPPNGILQGTLLTFYGYNWNVQHIIPNWNPLMWSLGSPFQIANQLQYNISWLFFKNKMGVLLFWEEISFTGFKLKGLVCVFVFGFLIIFSCLIGWVFWLFLLLLFVFGGMGVLLLCVCVCVCVCVCIFFVCMHVF